MKHLKYLSLLFVLVILFSCSDEDEVNPPPIPVNDTLTGNISASRTLTKDRKWVLKGYVYVTTGAILTIEAGTTIVGDLAVPGALVIERGAKIEAIGTPTAPIVFTSGRAVGARLPGDWGGIIILGNAIVNKAGPNIAEGGIGREYGGTNNADNSGTLKYVRIEYAGIAAQPNSEINSLSLYGVGSGTTIEYIQAAYSKDDAFEFFGGVVNCKYLVASYTADDDFDFDFGYQGKIQYGVSQRDSSFADTDAGNGIECDNDPTGSGATPFTRPVLSNFTFVGSNVTSTTRLHNFANRFRRNTRFVVRNSILMGYPKAGLSLESDGTATGYKNNESPFQDNLVHALTEPYKSNSTVITAADMKTKAESEGCITYTDPNQISLENPFSYLSPNFLPKSGSPALTGAKYSGDLDAFFTTGPFRGAFGTTNWLSGWTRFFSAGQ